MSGGGICDVPAWPGAQTGGRARFTGRVVIVTGGTSGIGKASIVQFGREGAVVVLTGRRAALGESVAAAIVAEGGHAQFLLADHTRPEDCQQVVDATLAAHGRVDVLLNNAGVVLGGSAEATSEADWQRVFDLNVTAVWRMSRLVLPAMRAQGGGVIANNASDWAVVGGRNAVARNCGFALIFEHPRCLLMSDAQLAARLDGRPVVRIALKDGPVIAGPYDPGGRGWVLPMLGQVVVLLLLVRWLGRRTGRERGSGRAER